MKKTKGRILKIRMGYNANSSSLGAVVTYLMFGAIAVSTVINMIAAARMAKHPGRTKVEVKS